MAQSEPLKNPAMLTLISAGNESNLNSFFTQLENIAKVAGWDEKYLVTLAKLKIEGKVKDYIENTPQVREEEDFKTFKIAVIDKFCKRKPFVSLLADFSSCRQNPNETVEDFATRLEFLAHQSLSVETEGQPAIQESYRRQMILSQFMDGLQLSLRAKLIVTNPKTMEEAKITAQLIEKSEKLLSSEVNAVHSSTRNSNPPQYSELTELIQTTTSCYAQSLAKLTAEIESLKLQMAATRETQVAQPQNQGQNSQIRCFNCNRFGHMARDCGSSRSQNFNRRNNFNRRGRGRGQHNLN